MYRQFIHSFIHSFNFFLNKQIKFLLFILVVLILSQNYLLSQTVIRERVEIGQKYQPITKSINSITSTHELTAEVSFQPTSYPWPTNKIGYIVGMLRLINIKSQFSNELIDKSESQGGSLNVSGTVKSNLTYTIIVSWTTTLGHQAYQYSNGLPILNVFLDGRLIKQQYINGFRNYTYVVDFSASPCADAPQCDQFNYEIPTFISSIKQNGWKGLYICQPRSDEAFSSGEFSTTLNGYENFEVETCYNGMMDRWQYKVKGDVLFPIVIMDFCEAEILSHGKKPIYSVSDLANETNPCDALEDIKNFKFWPNTVNKYVFKDLVMIHENEHRRYYEGLFQEYTQDLINDLDNEIKRCSDFSYEKASSIGIGNYQAILYKHFERIGTIYGQNTSDGNEMIHENGINQGALVTSAINHLSYLVKLLYECQ